MPVNLDRAALGIEVGSTRIKAVLIDENYNPVASGSFEWESKYINNIWTYNLDKMWLGIQYAYKKLAEEFYSKYCQKINKVGSIGFSGMMHGYLPFDYKGKQLVPFRTWRNTITEESSRYLSELFQFNIPQRWSISHLYQALINNEEHVKNIDFLTTLVGYIHWQLTDEKVLGIGEASGMFPIDSSMNDYDSSMIKKFNKQLKKYPVEWKIEDLLPEVKLAGEIGGYLTQNGAALIDPTGILQEGIPIAPPEGDAGTGMIATNTVAVQTGNVSAGTSIFSMIVLEKKLSNYYVEIDMVTTPSGEPVAMVHCNNFTSDINDWVSLFKEVILLMGFKTDDNLLFTKLYKEALNADLDVGKMVGINYFSGEPITNIDDGRPLFIRMPDSQLNIANFMRTQIYSALATLKIGMDILLEKESVTVDYILGHGGFFKTEIVSQQIMADVLNIPVSVMDTASEGGPWGMAVLASYMINKGDTEDLVSFLNDRVFLRREASVIRPTTEGVKSFSAYMIRYLNTLNVERAAIAHLNE